jgi:hypothetical protein
MTNRKNSRTLLENPLIPVQIKLAAAWTSLMYLVLYIDYFHLFQPGEIDVIRGGNIFTFEISGNLITVFFLLVSTPALMALFSLMLPARVNRTTNLVAASLWVPFCLFNAAGATPDFVLYYTVTIGVEVLILAFIIRSAWTWPRIPAASAGAAHSELQQPV